MVTLTRPIPEMALAAYPHLPLSAFSWRDERRLAVRDVGAVVVLNFAATDAEAADRLSEWAEACGPAWETPLQKSAETAAA